MSEEQVKANEAYDFLNGFHTAQDPLQRGCLSQALDTIWFWARKGLSTIPQAGPAEGVKDPASSCETESGAAYDAEAERK